MPITRDASLSAGSLLDVALGLLPEGVAICEHGRIVYASAAFAAILGFDSPSPLHHRLLTELIPAEHPCLGMGAADRSTLGTSEQGTPVCEFRFDTPSGVSIPVQASCLPFHDAGRDLVLVTIRDVRRQERRRVTRDGDRRYRAIFNAAAIGIVQCDTQGHVIESNPALQRMLGYSREELRGMHFRDFTHPEDLAADAALFNEMVEGKRDYYQIELRYTAKGDVTGWVRLTVSLVSGPDRRSTSMIGMAEDITEYKRAEQQLREAQKMEVIGRLVGGVAHDFNNLLTGIMLYCDLIRDGLDPESRLRHHAEEIRLAGEQGAALVQQLLSVARQQPVHPRVLCVNETVNGMRNLLRRLITENIQFEIQLAGDLWPVKMDPTQVQQIILNLALNARDAMPDGGWIRVETRNVETSAALPVELSVSDNGCGISPEVRAHLFEPFFTTKAPGQGNGLGLATVHDIVHHCGGSIDVVSEPGQGTRVAIRLPRANEEPAVESVASTPPTSRTGGTILVVEDNPTVRRSAVHILQEAGYAVLEASNGQEASTLCLGRPATIDLLLVDLIMPGMDGRQVAQTIRFAHPETRVLYTSGYAHALPREKHDPELFRKPYSADTLLERVREILDQDSPSFQKRGNLS